MATIYFASDQLELKKEDTNNLHQGWVEKISKEVFTLLPSNLRNLISQLASKYLINLEEIRLRKGRTISFKLVHGDYSIDKLGNLVNLTTQGYKVTEDDFNNTLQSISNCSVYALEEEFRRGFITVKGGHRVGIVGKAILAHGHIKTQKEFSSINIRLAREVKGVARLIMPLLIDKANGAIHHVLILSPPGCGKTTLLRDLVRLISEGIPELKLIGVDVGLIDERSEIAACYGGLPQNDVGIRTDVLDACPKAEGMVVMLRSMNPRVIATDEIGSQEDAKAILEVLNCGVKLVTTVHGNQLNDLMKRPALKKIIEASFVGRFVVMGNSRGVGTIEGIYDGIRGKNLLTTAIGGSKSSD